MHGAAPDAAASNPALTEGPESKPPTSNALPDPNGSTAERAAAEQPKGRAAHLAAHRFQPGQSGNPAGRPPGIPNLNAELLRAVMAYKGTRDRSYLDLLLETALQKPELAIALLHKLFATVTPEAAGIVVNNTFEGLLARLTGGQGTDDEPPDDGVQAPALKPAGGPA